jgi:hypothetical protein
VIALVALPGIPRGRLSVDPLTAAALARIEPLIPADAEVIATGAVIGRFGERDVVYGFLTPGETIAVRRPRVVFIITPYEILDDRLSPKAALAAVRYIRHQTDVTVLGGRSDVEAFSWTPPPGTRRVTLP